MPRYEITGPDGAKYEISAPDGASEQDILSYAQTEFSKQPTTRQKVMASTPMRVVQGMRDPFDAGAQMLPRALGFVASAGGLAPNPVSDWLNSEASRVDKGISDAEREYEVARKATGSEGMDIARGVGNVLSPANLAVASRVPMAATTAGRVGTGVAAGAAGGALSPVDMAENESFAGTKAAQVGLGGVTGGVMNPVLGKFGDALGRRVQRFLQDREVSGARASLKADQVMAEALAEIGAKLDELPKGFIDRMRQQVVTALKEGKELDAAALMRKADFEAAGIKPTLGQITRDATQFANERNLRGVANVGEPLMQRFAEQNKALTEGISRFGGEGASQAFPAGERAVAALKAIDDDLAKQVRAAYQAARESTGKDMTVPLQGFAQDFAKVVKSYGKDNIPSAVKAYVNELGLMGGKQKKVFSMEDAEELIQLINKNYDPMKKAQASALNEIRGAVKNAILAADDQGGAFKGAREAARKRFQLQEMVPALKAASDGTASPDDFVQRYVINGKTNDLKNMVRLSELADPALKDEVRGQVGSHLLRAAFGENPAGDALFTPTRFAKAVREIGDAKLKAIYTDAEVEQIKRLGRVGAYINSQPTAAPVNYSNTGGVVLSALQKIPGVPAAIGLLASGQKALANNRTVASGMAAEVPQRPADLLPGTKRLVSKGSAAASVLGGTAAADEVR